jgi:hypothetical protein
MLGLRSAEGVFLHHADGGQPVRVAGPRRDAVGDRVLREVQPGLVAVDDRRRVAFLARLDDGLHVLLTKVLLDTEVFIDYFRARHREIVRRHGR